MAYNGLNSFIRQLEESGQLIRISTFVDPILEITEVTDRISKNGGAALLFENNGTDFPVLINAFGSEIRMARALGRETLEQPSEEIERIFKFLTGPAGSVTGKLSSLPKLLSIARYLPSKSRRKGRCQQIIHTDPDLGMLPVLKCWPYDGGRFITLPVVNTIHPVTLKPNAGMYRMQILDRRTTAMHWQLHKTGASHFEEWKKTGGKMPVSVILGGDPVYTYTATAPLPENIDEYILAGFLRRRKVSLVKCLTNEIYVPEDADIVIEGYVDPSEELFWEGPFGDHTGFYSLADWYPKFHVTCITQSKDAVYPATIVGIPPMEDAFIARATEKIFLAPIKLTLQPEIEDLHMPDAGVAHNLALVRISKSYPGQGMKVINSLLGAGQMMFTKYLVVVSGDVDLRDYPKLLNHIIQNTEPFRDLFFCRGPLDVLDHSSDTFAFGGKLGIDATIKTAGEINGRNKSASTADKEFISFLKTLTDEKLISAYNIPSLASGSFILIISVNVSENPAVIAPLAEKLENTGLGSAFRLIVIVDHTVDISNLFMVSWQLLGNSDPMRDHRFISDNCLLIDGTIKLYRERGFPRQWPNVVCSDESTISETDRKWESLGTGPFIPSPSLKNKRLEREGREEIKRDYLKPQK